VSELDAVPEGNEKTEAREKEGCIGVPPIPSTGGGITKTNFSPKKPVLVMEPWFWGSELDLRSTSPDSPTGCPQVRLDFEGVQASDAMGPDGSRRNSFYAASSNRSTVRDTGTNSTVQSSERVYDVFLSHLQRNGQDAVISLQMFLKQSRPAIKCFIDLDVDMKGDLTGTLKDAVMNCRCFLFFITDGILTSPWCLQELRWAVEYDKSIVLVRETDARHGGIEMNDFMRQVPDDLTSVFSNIIAIPWYRQPAFRTVSVDSIIKACELEDTFAEDMRALDEMRIGLQVVAKGSAGRISCFDYIAQESIAMRGVFFLGGFQRFRSPWMEKIYKYVFAGSFWACAIVCTTNLVYQGMPFHHFVSDAVTAYVHLPAWQAWSMWRDFVKSPVCDELLYMAIRDEQQAIKLARLCRVGGWLVLFVQIVMCIDVFVALSMPWTLAMTDMPGLPQIAEVGNFSQDGLAIFTAIHALVMWVVIIPVVASLFASYWMFAFVAILHTFDVTRLGMQLVQCMARVSNFFNQHSASELSSDQKQFMEGGHTKRQISGQERESVVAMERALCDVVVDVVRMLFGNVQMRIDTTCKVMGPTWFHMFCFTIMEILSIRAGIRRHFEHNEHSEYHWWWMFQDFWHLIGGTVLILSSMWIFAYVTITLRHMALRLARQCEEAGCSRVMQSMVLSFVTPQNLGLSLFGQSMYIDAPQASVLTLSITVLVVETLVELVNHLNIWLT